MAQKERKKNMLYYKVTGALTPNWGLIYGALNKNEEVILWSNAGAYSEAVAAFAS